MINTSSFSARSMLDLGWNLTLVMALYICAALVPDMAHAAGGGNAIQSVFCNVVGLVNGPTGAAIATVAVIAVGVGALMGKISWAVALIVALGIAIVFGASGIVTAISQGVGSGGSC